MRLRFWRRAEPRSEPIEGKLYRVVFEERPWMGYKPIEKTMTARYSGRTNLDGGWIPLWTLDPSDQWGISAGLIGEVISWEEIRG